MKNFALVRVDMNNCIAFWGICSGVFSFDKANNVSSFFQANNLTIFKCEESLDFFRFFVFDLMVNFQVIVVMIEISIVETKGCVVFDYE
jgi:hypothetical protein